MNLLCLLQVCSDAKVARKSLYKNCDGTRVTLTFMAPTWCDISALTLNTRGPNFKAHCRYNKKI
jgi:hypothetical protein